MPDATRIAWRTVTAVVVVKMTDIEYAMWRGSRHPIEEHNDGLSRR